ncbi:MAG: DUF4142 domain-containing protein [Acidobacteriaceae bacterium]|nr:DUF4142 domain-containing protein [Acidobacteriaceae bacterium]
MSGHDFRKQYFSDPVSAHKSGVSLFERYGKGGDNPKLNGRAWTTLPALQQPLSPEVRDGQARLHVHFLKSDPIGAALL